MKTKCIFEFLAILLFFILCISSIYALSVTLISPNNNTNFTTGVINFSVNLSNLGSTEVNNLTVIVYNSSGFEFNDSNSVWDISKVVNDNLNFSVFVQESDPNGIFFKPDGTKMYILGDIGNRVYQYSLSSAWNVSSASYDNVNFSVTNQDNLPMDALTCFQ